MFEPGDAILLKRGTVAKGELSPKGSGNEKSAIIIDAYGTGELPIIDAQGKENSAAIRLFNQEYWIIQNIEVHNNAQTFGSRWGIYVYSNDSSLKRSIHIKNTVVKNVYASNIRKEGDTIPSFYKVGGIYIKVEEPGRMDDVLLENNLVEDIVGIGISFWGENEWKGGGMNWDNLSTNVVVRNNAVRRTGADGIIVLGTDNVLIEHNFVDGAGELGSHGDVPGKPNMNGTDFIAGIWPTRHRNGLVQYNEVCNTRRFFGDGQAFDNDMLVQGSTIFQYNYSHNNEGGFFLDCCSPEETNTGTIIRYNISQNDGKIEFILSQKGQATFYNNVFFTEDSLFIKGKSSLEFYNNIFITKGAVWNDNKYLNNCYSGGAIPPPNDSIYVAADPELMSPGSGGYGLETTDGYKLNTNSPCKHKGLLLKNHPAYDFWGNKINSHKAPHIGVYNGE